MPYSSLSMLRTLPKIMVVCALFSVMLTSGCSKSNDKTSTDAELTNLQPSSEDVSDATELDIELQKIDDLLEATEGQEQEEESQLSTEMATPESRLARALPVVHYEANDLSSIATAANNAVWIEGKTIDEATAIKIQALLNYNHHSVGAVDGRLGQNVAKALKVFQEKQGLETTGVMNSQTWQALTINETINRQPVLVNYLLTPEDVKIPYHPKGQQYHSVTEAVAEKFHISQGLLLRLNPNTALKAGNKIVVYNPYRPNMIPVAHVVANKQKNLLLAYDKDHQLVASYPTTMGSNYRPSPNGEYKVSSRIMDPTYNKDFSNKDSVLPPGPNNPVGRVWIGINKPSFGIHGSPNPEKISQQSSAGCVRLTNWDVLGLFGTIEEGATVKFE